MPRLPAAKVDGRAAIITGGAPLSGAKVCATDLRAGAALICAALVADGESEISGTHHIDRGYVNIAGKLAALGAQIERVESVVAPVPVAAVAPVAAQEPAVVTVVETVPFKREKEVAMMNVQPTWA